MKKILIVTLYGNFNYGNKLQNYAVQEIFKEMNYETYTLTYPEKKNKLKSIIKRILGIQTVNDKRINNFKRFDRFINKISQKNVRINELDFISLGSDQIWNPNDEMSNYFVHYINKIDNINKMSFSASIAVNEIPVIHKDDYLYHFRSMNSISIREDQGKIMIEELTGRNDIEVLLDPTMIMSTEKWENILSKPDKIHSEEKYILNYFLGELDESRKEEIKKIADENNCRIIDILDPSDEYYTSGPDEFLWLEKNAFLICTDSFHSSVFAILYNKPFVVFNREEGQNGINKTNSRLETLLKKFDLLNRYYNGKMPEELFNVDYSEALVVLETERKKALSFISNALKDGEKNEK